MAAACRASSTRTSWRSPPVRRRTPSFRSPRRLREVAPSRTAAARTSSTPRPLVSARALTIAISHFDGAVSAAPGSPRAPDHGHGRTDAHAAGAAYHLRPQGELAHHARRRSSDADRRGPAGPVRRCRRHECEPGRPEAIRRAPRPRRAGRTVAREPRAGRRPRDGLALAAGTAEKVALDIVLLANGRRGVESSEAGVAARR